MKTLSFLDVKIADPKKQKVMNQPAGQQQSWTGKVAANKQSFQQKQANLGKNQKSKPGNYSRHAPLNLFGTTRNASSFTKKPPPKVATSANAIPIGR